MEDLNERLLPIGPAISLFHLRNIFVFAEPAINGAQNPSVKGHQMRSKRESYVLAGKIVRLMLHFSDMAVSYRTIRHNDFITPIEQVLFLELTASPGDPRLGVTNDLLSDLPIAYYAYMLYNMHPKENPRKID
ncbi:hypothetical protein HKBW3S25_01697 [Candidatus Hakubella thermalkaliphila]|uniref:Uncharacterized protein n=1 Tax=Candidatus Hakubella thermalkaliphila TaxID=2754717 RepID=A0A6V8P5Z1_9ACTN|nr:hypothetical protein HKBW3S25_01697 [Candidatus Hakubella thermalkaliphila]